jgi:AraC-like DNA-binding protein
MKKATHPYLTRQNMMTSDYEIFHYSDTNLYKVNLHHHDFYECYLFISGDVTYIIEGKTYTLIPGDIVLINSRDLHQPIINKVSKPYERIVLWINKEFLNSLSTKTMDLKRCFEDSKRKNVLRTDFEVQANIRNILFKLLNLETYKGMGKDLLYKAYLVELFVYINTQLFHNNSKASIEIKKSSLIDEIIQYINNNIKEDIRLDELSEKFYISKYHMLREFKKHTGTTIHKFIIQKKLILAKEYILNGMPINSVYEHAGFGDYSNFFRAFKNEYGLTPKQFYKMMKRE